MDVIYFRLQRMFEFGHGRVYYLFEKFLEAMEGHEPTLIITDQDPAMKVAIVKIFNSSTHRFCMWHIMKKKF